MQKNKEKEGILKEIRNKLLKKKEIKKGRSKKRRRSQESVKERKIEISEMLKETLKKKDIKNHNLGQNCRDKIENLFFSEKIPSPPKSMLFSKF